MQIFSNSLIVACVEYDVADLELFEINESEFLGYTGTVSELLLSVLDGG